MDDEMRKLAEQVWRIMFGFLVHTRPRRDAAMSRLGLTANELKALYSLEGERGRTMKELAAEWNCDASSATWTVDRLEANRLAERRPHPRDRRVRLVVLTSTGVAAREEMLRGMYDTPPELLELDMDELRVLYDLLAKLPIASDAFPGEQPSLGGSARRRRPAPSAD
jgi:MarR family transcriptional regulator, organic hydroperoxide resistance regulator